MNVFDALVEPGRGQVLFATGLVMVIPEAESRYAAVIAQLLAQCRGAGADDGAALARQLAHIVTADDSAAGLPFGFALITDARWSIAVHGDMSAIIDDEMVISGKRSLLWRELLLERPFHSLRIAQDDPSSVVATALTQPSGPGTVRGSGVVLKPRHRDQVDADGESRSGDDAGGADATGADGGGAVTVPYLPMATARYTPPAGVLVLDDGTSRLLEGTIVLGREPATDAAAIGTAANDNAHELVLNDTVNGVSRVHAKITVTATGAVVTDLGSANGTYVCDEAGSWAKLASGEAAPVGEGFRLRIGERQMQIVAMPTQKGSTT